MLSYIIPNDLLISDANCNDDVIKYLVISTNESDKFVKKFIYPCDLNDFNKKYKCRCLSVWNGSKIKTANYDTNTWISNEISDEVYNIYLSVRDYINNYNEIFQQNKEYCSRNCSDIRIPNDFIIFELIYDADNSSTGKQVFTILKNFDKLDFCRIWSTYFVDLLSLRRNHTAFVLFDTDPV